MSRDWQKDMDDVKTYLKNRHLTHHEVQTLRGTPVADVLHYWLQEFAEAMKLLKEVPSRFENGNRLLEQTNSLWAAEKEHADRLREHIRKLNIDLEYAEVRERKLRGTLEYEIELHVLNGSGGRERELRELLASLYPKEGEE